MKYLRKNEVNDDDIDARKNPGSWASGNCAYSRIVTTCSRESAWMHDSAGIP